MGDEVEVGKPLVTIDVGGTSDSGDATPSVGGAAVVPQTGPGAPPEEAAVAEMVPDARPDRPVDGADQGTIVPADDGGSGNVLVGYGTGGGGRSRRRRAGGPAGAAPARR